MGERTVVLDVSTDSAGSHRAFAEEHRIGFSRLSDSDGSVAEPYRGLVEEVEYHRRTPLSAIFVVGPDKEVQYAWQSESPDDELDMRAVEKATNCCGERCEFPESKSDWRFINWSDCITEKIG